MWRPNSRALWRPQRGGQIPEPSWGRSAAIVDIARGMPVARPAVSQHLKVLKSAGLVVDQPVGNQRIYAIDPGGGLVEAAPFPGDVLSDALSRFTAFAERTDS